MRDRGSLAGLGLAKRAEEGWSLRGVWRPVRGSHPSGELGPSTPLFPRHPVSLYGYTKCPPRLPCCQGLLLASVSQLSESSAFSCHLSG